MEEVNGNNTFKTMAKINVNLNAFHGYGCGFQSYSSNETIEIEVSDNELEALS